MDTSSQGYQKPQSSPEEQVLYNYFLQHRQTDSPAQLIEDFRHLFVEGQNFRDGKVYLLFEKMVKKKDVDHQFNVLLNQCCHVLINTWQKDPALQSSILELISLFEHLIPPRRGYQNTSNRVRHLVKNFTLSDHYIKLQRLARVIEGQQSTDNLNLVGSLIHRYPYLYNHYLLGEESSQEHQYTVRRIKAQTERRFEVNLSRYVTYQVRLVHSSQAFQGEGRMIHPVPNPTLLNDKELNRVLKNFVGTAEGEYTYKKLSQKFLNQTARTPTFGKFKDELYEYLLASIDPQYGKGHFNKKLYQLLQNTLPECHQQKPSEFLMLRTLNHILSFLILENAQHPDHYIFIDMISNMGVTQTMGVLLKVVLIYPKVKPYLEKRFSILFNHYESFDQESTPWLIKSLENLQLAFSIYFGKVDLSCLNQVKLQ